MIEFRVSKIEEERFETWLIEHDKICPWRYKNRFFTYSFTPTGIGSVIEVKCRCGESVDITDESIW